MSEMKGQKWGVFEFFRVLEKGETTQKLHFDQQQCGLGMIPRVREGQRGRRRNPTSPTRQTPQARGKLLKKCGLVSKF